MPAVPCEPRDVALAKKTRFLSTVTLAGSRFAFAKLAYRKRLTLGNSSCRALRKRGLMVFSNQLSGITVAGSRPSALQFLSL